MTTPTEPYQAVLFDLGGVLTKSPFTTMAANMIDRGIDPRLGAVIAVGADDYASSTHPFHRLECGTISLDEYNAAIAELALSHGISAFGPMPDLDLIMDPSRYRHSMIALADEVRAAGYVTGVVTNNIASFGTWRNVIDAERRFDVVIDSCEVGLRKPGPDIYLLAARKLGVDPTACIFLDDMHVNVEGARAIGMTAIHVDASDRALEAVRELLVIT